MCFANRSAAQRYRACQSAILSSSLISLLFPFTARASPYNHGGCLNNTLTLISAVAAVACAYIFGHTSRALVANALVANDALVALTTTGASSNYVVSLDIPTERNPDYWVRMGVAGLCALAE